MSNPSNSHDEKAVADTVTPSPPAPELSPVAEKKVPTVVQAPQNEGTVPDGEVATEQPVEDSPNTGIGLSKARQIALVATLTGASFMNTASLQSVIIILPAIGETLSIPEQRLQWIVSAYSLAFGCFLLLWGRIADLHGKRNIFILGSAWAAVVTIANAFVPNEIAFNLFRGLHGLAAAANVPAALGILGTTFPPGKAKNYAFSAYAAGAPMGSVFGNLMAGFIAQYLHWRWVFGVKAILGGIVTAAGLFVIPRPKAPAIPQAVGGDEDGATANRYKKSIDWIGAFLVTVGLLALLYALTEGNVVGWSKPQIPVVITASVLILVVFYFWQRHLEKKGERPPLMKVSLLKNKRFAAAMLIMALFFASFNNYLLFATYFFQDYQGLSALQTTLRFIPTGVAGLITAFIVALLLSKVPTYLLLVCGHVTMAISALLFATPIPPTTSYFAYGLPAMIFAVIGADTAWPSLTLFTSKSLPQEDQAVGGALINAIGQIGRAVGLAITTAVQTGVMAESRGVIVQNVGSIEEWDGPSLDGIRAGQWSNFAFVGLSLLIVLFVFRSSEIVGKAEPAPPRSGAEEAVVDEDPESLRRTASRK